jgi:hypothetical protein
VVLVHNNYKEGMAAHIREGDADHRIPPPIDYSMWAARPAWYNAANAEPTGRKQRPLCSQVTVWASATAPIVPPRKSSNEKKSGNGPFSQSGNENWGSVWYNRQQNKEQSMDREMVWLSQEWFQAWGCSALRMDVQSLNFSRWRLNRRNEEAIWDGMRQGV